MYNYDGNSYRIFGSRRLRNDFDDNVNNVNVDDVKYFNHDDYIL